MHIPTHGVRSYQKHCHSLTRKSLDTQETEAHPLGSDDVGPFHLTDEQLALWDRGTAQGDAKLPPQNRLERSGHLSAWVGTSRIRLISPHLLRSRGLARRPVHMEKKTFLSFPRWCGEMMAGPVEEEWSRTGNLHTDHQR